MPLEALQNVGRAYLAFARNEPAYYAAMFETGLPKVENIGLQESANRAFDVLYQATKKLIEKLPESSRPPCQMVALHIWAMSHGIASLFGRVNANMGSAISPEELLEAGVLIYLRGLGLAGGAAPAATLCPPPPPYMPSHEYACLQAVRFGYRLYCQVRAARLRRFAGSMSRLS